MQNFKEYVDCLERNLNKNKKDILFVCIGTTKVVGDSIGPLVGSLLKSTIGDSYVLGDIDNNICGRKDLIYHYPELRKKFIVAIDSALSKENLKGEIFVSKRPIIMGRGVNRNKGVIGDVSIKASIGDLEMIDEAYIYNMSKIIAKGIYTWHKKFSIRDRSQWKKIR